MGKMAGKPLWLITTALPLNAHGAYPSTPLGFSRGHRDDSSDRGAVAMEGFYTVKEVCKLLRVARETLRRWELEGGFPRRGCLFWHPPGRRKTTKAKRKTPHI